MPLAKPATQAQEKAFTTSEGSVTESVQVAWLRVATFFNFFAFLPVDCLDFGSRYRVFTKFDSEKSHNEKYSSTIRHTHMCKYIITYQSSKRHKR